MAVQIFALDKVRESELVETVKKASDDEPNFVTAINDGQGTFTVESTFISDDGAAANGSSITLQGKMSHFGGPQDTGVKPDEGLAIMDASDVATHPDLFLPAQPPGTTGTARRLNPDANYIACRWDFKVTPKSFLKNITVKVTNPANGKSANATPTDWGPNVTTGRIADLSPGLEQTLGLTTDKECTVEIPTPAGAQMPPASAPADADAVPLAFDSTVFPQNMTRTLVALTVTDKATFWVMNIVGKDEGGQSVLRHAGDKTDVLLSDTMVFPIKPSDQIPSDVADELNKAVAGIDASADGPGANPPQPGDDINAKMFAEAKAFVGHDTSNVPGTDHGNLACAWAVNQVTHLALGKPISADAHGGNGLGTDGIFAALKAHHTRLNSESDAKPGTIIIAPTVGANHGHVGIVGATTGGVGDTLVYSNKSRPGVFSQNYTIKTFTDHYTKNGLRVLFFALNRDQFV